MKKFLCRFMSEDFFVIQITHTRVSLTIKSHTQRYSDSQITHTRVTVKFPQVYLKFSVFMICIFRIQFLMKNAKNHIIRKTG